MMQKSNSHNINADNPLLDLKRLLHPKINPLEWITYPPRRSKPVKALFVFWTQHKILWMKTGSLVTVPLTAK